ncbi:MAG: NAD-dependent dehydratase [Nitrosomonas sp.]|nr:MAG: NAD-dependent dehydratase [Nitrosomonas sp.]
MRSLVTGASGFLGSAVMHCLLNAGHEVRVLVRPESNRHNLENLPIQIFEGDLRDTLSLKHAVVGCDYLFHVAADYRFWVPDPKTMYDINVIGTQDLVRVAMEAGVTRIVYTSSVATLGFNHDGTPANEKTPSSLDTVNGHYKRSKFLAEQAVQQLTHTHNLPVIIVNPSTPIGPRDVRPTPTGRMVLDTVLGKMPAYINTGLNIAHVDDIAHGHLLALRHGKIGERYILGGEDMTLLQILQAIDDFTGKRVNRLRLPVKLMLPIAWLMERIASVTNSEPRATVDSIRMASKMMFFSSDKAKLDLGYQYRPATEALQDAVIWFKENGYCN